jgi:hypothetical protein
MYFTFLFLDECKMDGLNFLRRKVTLDSLYLFALAPLFLGG